MKSSSYFLKILILFVLILSCGLLAGCSGMGVSGGGAVGNIFNPVNQESDTKNTGGNDNNIGDPTSGNDDSYAGNSSPSQPNQPAAGKPKPPGGDRSDSFPPDGTVNTDTPPMESPSDDLGDEGPFDGGPRGKIPFHNGDLSNFQYYP